MKNKILCQLNIENFLCGVQVNGTSKENEVAKLITYIQQPRG